MWTLLLSASVVDAGSPEAAVRIALIGAVAPIAAVIVNELFKRWKHESFEEADRILAPVEEVPRAQYEALLERLADVDETLAAERDARASEAEWYRQRINELEADILQVRQRYERELDRMRDRLTSEIERRAAAEARFMGGGQR